MRRVLCPLHHSFLRPYSLLFFLLVVSWIHFLSQFFRGKHHCTLKGTWSQSNPFLELLLCWFMFWCVSKPKDVSSGPHREWRWEDNSGDKTPNISIVRALGMSGWLTIMKPLERGAAIWAPCQPSHSWLIAGMSTRPKLGKLHSPLGIWHLEDWEAICHWSWVQSL